MSIFNDSRRYGTDQERAEWERDMKWEFRGDDDYPDFPDEPERYCEECEYCKHAKRFVQEIVTRTADGKQVLKQTDRYCYFDVCVKDIENIREIHTWDKVCEDHGELFKE